MINSTLITFEIGVFLKICQSQTVTLNLRWRNFLETLLLLKVPSFFSGEKLFIRFFTLNHDSGGLVNSFVGLTFQAFAFYLNT